MRRSRLSCVPPLPPSVGASRKDSLRDLWTDAGLESVESREIAAERTFADFDDFWAKSTLTESIRPSIAAMAPADLERLKERVRARLPADTQGRITYTARANAIRGRVR